MDDFIHHYNPQTLKQVLHFAGDLQTKPWSFSGTLPPTLGVYLYLWQSIARFVAP